MCSELTFLVLIFLLVICFVSTMYFYNKHITHQYVHKKSGIVVELVNANSVYHNVNMLNDADIDIDNYSNLKKDEIAIVQSTKDGMYYIMTQSAFCNNFSLLK